MKTINTLVSFANQVVWMIGYLTILDYADRHWRVAYNVALGILLLAGAGWYCWKFVVEPFRSGLRGDRA